jgi:acyl dehydratase
MTGSVLADLAVGRSREQVVCTEISRTRIVQFAGATGDYSPLHTDEPHAVRAGYPGVMVHGMLVMAATAHVLTDWVGRDRIVRYGVRFLAPVWPGDTLTASATVEAIRDETDGRYADLLISTINQDGVSVLSGCAAVRARRVRGDQFQTLEGP